MKIFYNIQPRGCIQSIQMLRSSKVKIPKNERDILQAL